MALMNDTIIDAGVDTSDATATAEDILSGETAYVNEQKITGTMPIRANSDITSEGATVIVPAGYYATQETKSVSTTTQATPSISVSSSGLITASVAQTAGYVSEGTKSSTEQLTTQGAKEVTPTTTNQVAVSSGVYTTGAITVKGDSNLKAENIASGVSIFGIAGTHSGGSSGNYETCSVTISSQYTPSSWFVQYVRLNDTGKIENWIKPMQKTETTTTIDAVKGSNIFITSNGLRIGGGMQPTEAGRNMYIGNNESPLGGYGHAFILYETAPATATITVSWD